MILKVRFTDLDGQSYVIQFEDPEAAEALEQALQNSTVVRNVSITMVEPIEQ